MSAYLVFKSIHMLGIVLFLGNIIVTAWWKYMADRQGDPVVAAFAQRQVVLTDWIFTLGGVLLVLLGGSAMVVIGGLERQPWVQLGVGLFVASGVIWVLVLIPAQIKQSRMAKAFQRGMTIPPDYLQLSRRWLIWGTLAIVLPLMNLYVMVAKTV